MNENLINFYTDIHASEEYGNTSIKRYPYIVPLVKILKPKNIIDFGCGQSELHRIVEKLTGIHVSRYDPAINELSLLEQNHFDFLINIDVLEHIPEDGLDEVISNIRKLANQCFIIIDMRLAKQILPDGQNAHVTVMPAEWWEQKLKNHFPFVKRIIIKPTSRAAFVTFPLEWHAQFYVSFLTLYYRCRRSLLKRLGMKNS